MAAKLSKKQKRFVAEYLVDLNGTQAAIRAGYSKNGADVQAVRLLGNAKVQEALQKDIEKRNQRTEISQDLVLRELGRIGFSDLRNAVSWGPTGVSLKSSEGLTDDQAAAVAEVSETVTKDGGSTRIRLYDKVKALELIARHLGMLNDKLDLSNLDGSLTPRLSPKEVMEEIRAQMQEEDE